LFVADDGCSGYRGLFEFYTETEKLLCLDLKNRGGGGKGAFKDA
jgi:hypothetical protein